MACKYSTYTGIHSHALKDSYPSVAPKSGIYLLDYLFYHGHCVVKHFAFVDVDIQAH